MRNNGGFQNFACTAERQEFSDMEIAMQNGARLWDIVTGTETLAEGANADARKKFVARSDRALAIIVLAVDPSLLYLLGEANKLHMRRKLETQRRRNDHIKMMTKIFEALAYRRKTEWCASLMESFNVLVTALCLDGLL